MATKQVPSTGRVVHYVLNEGKNVGSHRPATIIFPWDPTNPDSSVQLQVLTDGDGGLYNDGLAALLWRTSVMHDETEKKPGTWHWPEFVPPVEVE